MTELGDPITTQQAARAILAEIHSPVVGDLSLYDSVGAAFEYCLKKGVFDCLSSGEKRLVRIAHGVYGANESGEGSGVAALGGLDSTLRRKVWMILGYLYLGRDIHPSELQIDFAGIKAR
jgi:hypothetical protein